MKIDPPDPPKNVYLWRGEDAFGQACRGTLQSPDADMATQALQQQGVTVTALRLASEPLPMAHRLQKGLCKKVIAHFTHHLALLLEAGIPILNALTVLTQESENRGLAALAAALTQEISNGASLSEAFAKHPKYFNDLYRNLIWIGESTGNLEGILSRLAVSQQRSLALRASLKKASMHPLIMMFVTLVIAAILLTQVVPEFEQMFSQQQQSLPGPTRWVLAASRHIQHAWLIYASIMALGLGAGILGYRRIVALKQFMHRLVLAAPIIGPIVRDICQAEFALTLSITQASGLPMATGLSLAGKSCPNFIFGEAATNMQRDIESGLALSVAMGSKSCVSKLLVMMTAIGEETGCLDKMLEQAADHYAAQAHGRIERALPLIEPAMMLCLGSMIGGLIIALYLPMFQMGTLFSP